MPVVPVSAGQATAATAGFPLRRAAVALGASMLVHLFLAGDWGGSGRSGRVTTPLQARLAPAAMPGSASSVVPPVAGNDAVVAQPATLNHQRLLPAAEAEPPALAVAAADPRFYAARELDRFPSPLVPLPGTAAGDIRLWLGIDRQGVVVDVASADPAVPLPEGLVERLRGLRFVPALKDGRPVNSRVLLALRSG
jgi:hypothetical protein